MMICRSRLSSAISSFDRKKSSRTLLLAAFFVSSTISCASADISFDIGELETTGIASIDLAVRAIPLSDEMRKSLSARALIREVPISGLDEDMRLMLVCSGADQSGAANDVQLLLAVKRDEKYKAIQRFKIGKGSAPELLYNDESDDFMLRIQRAGGDAECVVYTIDRKKSRISETFKISRSVPSRMKLDIKALLKAGGLVTVTSKRPACDDIELDLSKALDALIEDAVYQENGRPISNLVNLQLARIGWEGEGIRWTSSGTLIDMGVSLSTISKVHLITGRVTFERSAGKWQPATFTCEPFFAYSDQ